MISVVDVVISGEVERCVRTDRLGRVVRGDRGCGGEDGAGEKGAGFMGERELPRLRCHLERVMSRQSPSTASS